MSKHSWLVSVLDDLESYAKENELPSLLDELSKAKRIAQAEVAFDAKGHLPCAESSCYSH